MELFRSKKDKRTEDQHRKEKAFDPTAMYPRQMASYIGEGAVFYFVLLYINLK